MAGSPKVRPRGVPKHPDFPDWFDYTRQSHRVALFEGDPPKPVHSVRVYNVRKRGRNYYTGTIYVAYYPVKIWSPNLRTWFGVDGLREAQQKPKVTLRQSTGYKTRWRVYQGDEFLGEVTRSLDAGGNPSWHATSFYGVTVAKFRTRSEAIRSLIPETPSLF